MDMRVLLISALLGFVSYVRAKTGKEIIFRQQHSYFLKPQGTFF